MKIAIVGASGVVGRQMIQILEQRNFPLESLTLLASKRSAGMKIPFRGKLLEVEETTPNKFEGIQIALFSAGATASRLFAPEAASRNCLVIDNSSAWRMDAEVPLVVPEVNSVELKNIPKGIIANPNCCAIPLTVVLKPLHDVFTLRHVVVSTYQAASGKGHAAVEDLKAQTKDWVEGRKPVPTVFPGQMVQNLLMDWKPGENDYSEEEIKIVEETRKILNLPNLAVTPTTVRVPVITSHAESVHIQFEKPASAKEVKSLLKNAEGVHLIDLPYAPGNAPQPALVEGTDAVQVGRVRDDLSIFGAINLWLVSDNLRKGAALNAIQIAEKFLRS